MTLKSRSRVVQRHSISLKMVPFESFGMVSYPPSILTMAVSLAISQIFSIKEWPDIEIWVWGRSRSVVGKNNFFFAPDVYSTKSTFVVSDITPYYGVNKYSNGHFLRHSISNYVN